ncbi:MAG: ATP-binding cassette domain-containing protein [Verrucomicrobia bacterium]|nr:ATP-binding cassette domain-containing protein [Verrucomicrobiota bacterium]
MAIISVHDLLVQRSGQIILEGLTWEVRDDEHWVVLGANGSGKTSLLSCVTGYLTPSRGRICVLGRQYGRSDWRELRKEVGLVSSSIRHFIEDRQTALEVVASGRTAELNLWHRPGAALRKEAFSVLRQVEAESLADRPWLYLSQGERQRTLIGRALMARFRILILDEPCAGLDPVARERFLDFIRRLAETPKTPALILVTHHVEEILPCFSRALILHRGKVLAQGPSAQVITSEVLSGAFEADIKVLRRRSRFQLRVGVPPSQQDFET